MENVKPRKPRRYQRSRITRKKILDSATEVFTDKGYTKTNVEMISRKAGVGYGTIYCHYKGKDAILTAIVDYILYDVFGDQRMPGSIDDKEIVLSHYKDLLFSLFQLAQEHRPIFKVYQDATSKSEKVADHWDSIIQKLIDNLTHSFNECQDNGLVRDFDAQKGAKVFALLVDSFFWEVINEKEEDIDTIVNIIVDVLFWGIYLL